MQVVPTEGTGDGTVFRKTWHTNALVWTLKHYEGLEGTSLAKVRGETLDDWTMPEASVVQAVLGRAGPETPEQSSKRGKGQFHCWTWRALHKPWRSKELSDKAAGQMPHGWETLDGSEIRHYSSVGLGSVPNELSSAYLPAKENLPIHTQFRTSSQSIAGNNVCSYRIRYLFLCLYHNTRGAKKERKKSRFSSLWTYPRKCAWLKNLIPHILKYMFTQR